MLCAMCSDAKIKYYNRKANKLLCKNISCYLQF